MRVSIAENNGSIFHCDFHYFVSGGGGVAITIIFCGENNGSSFHFESIIFSGASC